MHLSEEDSLELATSNTRYYLQRCAGGQLVSKVAVLL